MRITLSSVTRMESMWSGPRLMTFLLRRSVRLILGCRGTGLFLHRRDDLLCSVRELARWSELQVFLNLRDGFRRRIRVAEKGKSELEVRIRIVCVVGERFPERIRRILRVPAMDEREAQIVVREPSQRRIQLRCFDEGGPAFLNHARGAKRNCH